MTERNDGADSPTGESVDQNKKDEPIIRLQPERSAPSRPLHEMKSKQPGIEDLTPAHHASPGLESEWGQASVAGRPMPWGWFALLGLLFVSGAVWSINHVLKADPQLEAIRHETETTLIEEERSVSEARELIKHIEQTVRAFYKATDIEELLRVSRHPERVRPLMEDHYSRHPLEPVDHVEIGALRPLTLGQHGGFWAVTLGLQDGENKTLIVEAEDSPDVRVDWETTVYYQPMDWDDFVETRPTGRLMDFRVFVKEDSFFSHEFADSEQWDCYQLTALDSDSHLFGYVRAGSPSAEMMRAWFKQYPNHRTTMILCLTIPEGLTSPAGVVIDHAKSVRWIYVKPPVQE